MKKYIKFFLLFFSASLLSCSSPQKESFITVKGTQFILKGKPYRFAGFNMWYACYLGASEEGMQRLIKELDALRSIGCTNLRILGASEETSMDQSLSKAIQTSPGVYNEEMLKGLDFTLTEMSKRGMYAVIYLNNYWRWSGGMSQYVNWSSGDSVPEPNSTGGGENFMSYSARFYSDSKATEMNRNYIKMLVNRVNSYSGLAYKDDPAIMAWELANEPRPGPDDATSEANIPAFVKWIRETSAWIHTIDPNHLVTVGSEGTVGCLQSEDYFINSNNLPSIDFVNFHLWAKNWGWFDAKRIPETLPQSERNAKNYILKHIELARKIGKPITMEEFGLDRDFEEVLPGTPVTARDEYFKGIFSLITDSILNGAPIAGVNIWAWGGFGKPAAPGKVMHAPSATVGDPLDEAQGLNSVYFSDSSTISIIKAYTARITSDSK
jgi:mannan endo-1,4-beta-mannosidase